MFLKALIYSIERNRDITEILANITAGNIRAVVEFVTSFIGSPNVEAEKIVEIYGKTGEYLIPIHEFSKAAILGDYSHFVPQSSIALNLFDVLSVDRKEHFLCLMIIAFLHGDTSVKDRDVFVRTPAIIQEMQGWGFLPDQLERAFRRLTNKRLIETTERITFEEDLVGLIGEIPDGFRVTSVGAYHLQRWAGVFAYLEAMTFDTPLFDDNVREEIVPNLSSYDIADRYDRAISFRNYLSKTWDGSALRPPYFDWNEVVRRGQPTFDAVRRFVDRRNSTEPRQRRGPTR